MTPCSYLPCPHTRRPQVAKQLVDLYHECMQGNFSTIERMQRAAQSGASKSHKQVVGVPRAGARGQGAGGGVGVAGGWNRHGWEE